MSDKRSERQKHRAYSFFENIFFLNILCLYKSALFKKLKKAALYVTCRLSVVNKTRIFKMQIKAPEIKIYAAHKTLGVIALAHLGVHKPGRVDIYLNARLRKAFEKTVCKLV